MLASHPGCGIVAKSAESGPHNIGSDRWMVVELGVGPGSGIQVTMDSQGFITSQHAPNDEGETPSMVFDIAWWKYEDGNDVNLVGEQRHNHRSRDGGGGRSFVLNEDGTISAAHAPHLCLGMMLPDVTLVSISSADKFIFDQAHKLQSGASTALTLASHPGYAVVPKFDPRRIDEWGVSYVHWGVAAAHNAAVIRKEGSFILSTQPASSDFILDVPFDKRHEGSDGIPMAVIKFDDPSLNKEHHNAARLFVVNGDGSISPERSPHLALGLRPGQPLAPLRAESKPFAAMSMPMATVEVVTVEAFTVQEVVMPVGISMGATSELPPLHVMAEQLKAELGIEEGSMADVIEKASQELSLTEVKGSLTDKAAACMRALGKL